MIFGVDTSFANGMPDWDRAVQDERVRWVYSRCCYGTDKWDDDGSAFTLAHDACKRLKIPFSAYMFWIAWEDGAAQAQHAMQVANGRYGGNRFIVDVEEGSGLLGWGASVQTRIVNLAATLDGIKAAIGEPMIYTNYDTWVNFFGGTDAFSGHSFIIAQYNGTPGVVDSIPGIKNIVGHQYSDGRGLSPIPGLSTPDNNVDRDVLLGGLETIARI